MSPERALGILLLILSACSAEEKVTPAPESRGYAGTLSLDIRGSAAVTLAIAPDGLATVTLQPDPSDTGGLLDPTTKLMAPAKVEPFHEAASELYTATFSTPARPGGLCGAAPISLGLSLLRRGDNAHVGGSLAAYCGADRFYGVPARVLRLSGDLPKSGPTAPGASK